MFPVDGMLVYGQATLPDGRVVASTQGLKDELSRCQVTQPSIAGDSEDGHALARALPTSNIEEEPELKGLELKPRAVAVGSRLNFTIFEVAKPQEMMEEWMMREVPPPPVHDDDDDDEKHTTVASSDDLDPFGVVLWPGAQLLASWLVGEEKGHASFVGEDRGHGVGSNQVEMVPVGKQSNEAENSLVERSDGAENVLAGKKSNEAENTLVERSDGAEDENVPLGKKSNPTFLFGRSRLKGRRVLCLGVGTGFEALAAASMGAHVVATDANPLPLALLRKASKLACSASAAAAAAVAGKGGGDSGWGSLETRFFDIVDPEAKAPAGFPASSSYQGVSGSSQRWIADDFNSSRGCDGGKNDVVSGGDFSNAAGWDLLLGCDLLVAADCIYNKPLARALARCCVAAWAGVVPAAAAAADSGTQTLSKSEPVTECHSKQLVTGASVLVADSQGFHKTDFLNALKEFWPFHGAPNQGFAQNAGSDQSATRDDLSASSSVLDGPRLLSVAMENVSGSGLLLDGDLNYNITVRALYLPGDV
jgi:hypothetical protein